MLCSGEFFFIDLSYCLAAILCYIMGVFFKYVVPFFFFYSTFYTSYTIKRRMLYIVFILYNVQELEANHQNTFIY